MIKSTKALSLVLAMSVTLSGLGLEHVAAMQKDTKEKQYESYDDSDWKKWSTSKVV